jgi:hypothetical protein
VVVSVLCAMGYERDVLAGFSKFPAKKVIPKVAVSIGEVVEHKSSGFTGSIVSMTNSMIRLRGRGDFEREFLLGDGAFLIAGEPSTLVRKVTAVAAEPTITRSGSVGVSHAARVAVGSRILVEGRHDAELVEHVWGDDLRHEGVVVEQLDGVDHLEAWLREFRPGPGRRVGVLVDHLVPGSKEARLVGTIRNDHVLVTGTPFVDVWESIRPDRVGLTAWPKIPMGTDWKSGICRVFNEPEPGRLWKKLLGRVGTYADLEPELVGAVEQLIDFVCAPSE